MIRIVNCFGYTMKNGLACWGINLETMVVRRWQMMTAWIMGLQRESRKQKDRQNNVGKTGLLLKNKRERVKNAWQYFEDGDEKSWESSCLMNSIFPIRLEGLIIYCEGGRHGWRKLLNRVEKEAYCREIQRLSYKEMLRAQLRLETLNCSIVN